MRLAAEENAHEAGGPGLATGRPDRLPRKPASPIRRADHIGASTPRRRCPGHGSGCHMRVLLASDGSSDALRATRWLRDMALPADTRVSVLTVATLTEPPSDSQTMGELRESLVTEARRAGERAAKILSRRWPVVDTLVTQGDPQVEIVHVAEDRRVGPDRARSQRSPPQEAILRRKHVAGRRPVRAVPCRDRPRSTAAGQTRSGVC
jgi:hypothetical protein